MKQAVTLFKNTCYQALRFEACLSFTISTLSKHRLCLTHACLIHFLGMSVVIGPVSYVA